MAYILELENGGIEESIRAGITHLLLVCTRLTPMDVHQFSREQNQVPNWYNKAYDSHDSSAFSGIFTYLKGSGRIQRQGRFTDMQTI